MSIIWWRIPGPAAWIADLASRLAEGQSLVLALPEGLPPGLRESLAQAAHRSPAFLVSSPDERRRYPTDRPLAHLAARHYGPDYPDLDGADGLVTLLEHQQKTLWLDRLTTAEWPAWRDILRPAGHVLRGLSPATRPCLVIPLSGSLAQEKSLTGEIVYQHLSCRALTTSLDHLIWATTIARERPDEPPQIRELVVALIAELAGGDIRLADILLNADLADLCEPHHLLTDYAYFRGWSSDTLARLSIRGEFDCWATGLIDDIGNALVIHSALLSLAQPESQHGALLTRRIWRAQLRSLFPWLEEQRWALIDAAAHLLVPPFTTSRNTMVDRAEDLDLGAIAWHLRYSQRRRTAADYALTGIANSLANARNELAHRSPLIGVHITSLIYNAIA